MVAKVELSKGMDITLAVPRRSFPLQYLISLAPVSCFYVLTALPFVTCRETLFIDCFRSRQIKRDKDRWHQSNNGGTSRPTRPRNLAVWAILVCPPWLLCCTSFAPKSCSVEKLAPAKFQVIWTPFGSLKVKNIKKRFSGFPRLTR
jgi:hypothetical protein